MKKNLLLASVCLVTGGAAYGQGQGAVIFENYGGTSSALIQYAATGVPPGKANLYLGNSFVAELGYFVGTTTDPTLITLLPASITTFYGDTDSAVALGANGAGAFQGPVINIPGVTSPALASAVTFEVFVWQFSGAFGQPTYLQALTSGFCAHSTIFTMSIGGTGTPPNIPLPSDFGPNLKPFTIGVPEPGTLAFAGLGAASLLLFRRRK